MIIMIIFGANFKHILHSVHNHHKPHLPQEKSKVNLTEKDQFLKLHLTIAVLKGSEVWLVDHHLRLRLKKTMAHHPIGVNLRLQTILVHHPILGVVGPWAATMVDLGDLHLEDGTMLDLLLMEAMDNKMVTMDLMEVMVDTTKIMFTYLTDSVKIKP